MTLQLGGGATWKGIQPGGMLPLRGTSQRISARPDEAEGLYPKGEHLVVPPALEAPQRGLGQPPALAQTKIPCRLPAWLPLPEGRGEMVRAAPEEQLQDYYESALPQTPPDGHRKL